MTIKHEHGFTKENEWMHILVKRLELHQREEK